MDYIQGLRGGLDVEGLPIMTPPYGRIAAIDLQTGDLWWIPNADTPDVAKSIHHLPESRCRGRVSQTVGNIAYKNPTVAVKVPAARRCYVRTTRR